MKHANGEWILVEPDEKLTFRASLPGAFGFDQAAHLLRSLQADGVPAIDLLPVALPTTWMVNAKATSKVFRAWLLPPARGLWEALFAQLNVSVDEWATLDEERETIASLVTRLSEGPGLAAVSKVLGLLRPQLVPLMDDAAIAFAIGAVTMPDEESATAAPHVFLPMIDWFAAQVRAGEPELIEIAKRHQLAVLDAPQVLDRMLWMDAWGERYRRPKRDAGS